MGDDKELHWAVPEIVRFPGQIACARTRGLPDQHAPVVVPYLSRE